MDQTVEKTVDRLSELLERANKAAQDFEVKDRLSDAVAALRRTRITQDDDSGVERFVTGLLIGVAVRLRARVAARAQVRRGATRRPDAARHRAARSRR